MHLPNAKSSKVNYKGFTLIELLITIAILATLMTIALLIFTEVQKKSRDAKRQSDLKVIQGALEQYHADQGFYPKNTNTGVAENFSTLTLTRLTNRVGNPITPTPNPEKVYLKIVPHDPQDSSPDYKYQYFASPSNCENDDTQNPVVYCTSYSLCANLENPPTGSTCSQGAPRDFEVNAP